MANTARPAFRPSLPRPILLLGHLLDIATKTPAEVAKPAEAAAPAEIVAAAPGAGQTVKNIALFVAAPFIGLAYALAFPFVGLALLARYGYRALANKAKAK